MTFEIETVKSVRLSNVNPRMEKHGPDSVPAVDMNFIFETTNDVLAYFDGFLLTALYTARTEAQSDQGEFDGLEPVSQLPNLRFPKMAPIKWDWRGAGYTLELDYGLGGNRNIVLDTCEVCKFVIDCKEGGTVELKFQVQVTAGLTEQIIGKLSMLIGQEVGITLRAPQTLGGQYSEVLDKFGEPLFPGYTPDVPLTAEDVFISTATAGELASVH